jgi:hypothetical protein
MLAMQTLEERIVAVLHDVVEDGAGWSLERLREEGFSEEIVAAVDAVTKRPSEEDDYEAFVRRAGENPIGRRVKRADLRDNCGLSRIAAPSERDRARVEKYQKAILDLDSLP